MSARIILTFSGQPTIDDSVTLNAQFVETFKASRSVQGEVAIGADVAETITNFESAIIADYGGVFDFTTETTATTITINFSNANNTFFDVDINSSVITFEILEGYFTYFRSVYDNKVDDFELLIQGTDSTFVQEDITAVGRLSYKDVDNVLEPIRGAQLDISIDASIDKPFDLFLDIDEKDFKVKFYRNGNLIFEGFVNPEGITQDYTSINWRAELVALDNLGALKNTEHPYNGETPSEFVFMDLALKQTGLNLPIAFFDDINRLVRINNVTQSYGAELNKVATERLINPEVFKNDNGRYLDCETILNDILQKYNAMLVQQSVTFYNSSTNENESMLCWLFCRVPLLSLSYPSGQVAPYKVREITEYVDGEPTINPYLNLSFANPTYRLGTDGQDDLDVIHKNKNQLIRQTRALRAFRFTQKWIDQNTILDDFGYSIFEILNTSLAANYFFQFGSSFFDIPTWVGYGVIDNLTFDPTQTIESQAIGSSRFVKLPTIEVPNGANTYKITGVSNFRRNISNNFTIFAGMQIIVLYTNTDGDRFYLQSPGGADDIYTLNQFFVNSENTFNQAVWVAQDEIVADANGNLTLLNVSNTYFNYYGNNEDVTINTSIEFPATPNDGGTIDIYFTPLYIRTKTLNSPASGVAEGYRFDIREFNFEIISPPENGIGNYYDAVNALDVSSKVGEPIEIINADDKSDIYTNGLKRKESATDEELLNYDYWTSAFNLAPNKEDILELTSIERVRLLSKSQNIFSGDIHGFIPYFTKIVNTAYPPQEISPGNFGIYTFAFTKWVYDTIENTIEAEMMECVILNPNVNFEKSVIFEDEDKKLIE